MKFSVPIRLPLCNGLALVPLIACLSTAGCGGGEELPAGSLSGTVTYKGEPVRDALILFYSRETGAAASAIVGNDGKYEVVSPVQTGTYAVSVVPPPSEVDITIATDTPPPADHPQIPAKYRSHESSQLTVTITEGSNRFDAELVE